MSLSVGARLGPYEILAPLGAGGMGEVYRARDTRLDRSVAIKVLPAQFAADPQFRERFEREAKALSQLTHPHICTLYDIGSQNGVDFLVMEYLEGETLAERLAMAGGPKGPPLRLEETLAIAIQISDALDKAHRAGIVHRDLKPGNIMLVRRGATSGSLDGRRGGPLGPPDAKLLDFGLAKTGAAVAAGAGLSMLPTTPPNLTAQGTILGTFQYMAPEQLEGREADARTDIFAFGAVLYEMLTGKKAFEGKSQAGLISAIMSVDPAPIASSQPLTPPALDRVVRICLAKAPDERWQSAIDLTRELKWVAEAGATVSSAISAPATRPRRERLAWTLLAAATLISAVLAWPAALYVRRPAPEPVVTRLDLVTPPTTDPFSFALSPDGRQIVFVASDEGGSKLWVRPLDQTAARPLTGTDGATAPFWAPDGRALGFFADAKMKRIDLNGGAAQALADAPAQRGGTWNRDGVVVFAPSTSGLMQVGAAGGTATALTRVARGQSTHRWPQFLPDGRRFLFFVQGTPDTQGVYVGSLDGGEPTRVLPVWSPDGSRIIFRSNRNGKYDLFEKSANSAADEQPLLATAQDKSPQSWSPDGRVLLYTTQDPKTQTDLWALPIGGDRKPFPVVQTGFDEVHGQFSPDGRWVAYASNESGHYEIYIRPFPAPGGKRQVLTAGGIYPRWRRDGRELFYVALDNRMMAVPIQVALEAHTLSPGAPVALFPTRLATGGNVGIGGFASKAEYAVAADGRFLLNVVADEEAASPITIVQNWTAALGK